MDNTMVLNNGFNELVFENRHKKYGAFEIRRRYRRSVILSSLLAISVFATGMITYVVTAPEAKATEPPKRAEEVKVLQIDNTPKEEKKEVKQDRVITNPPPKGPDVAQQTTPTVTMDSVAAPKDNDSTGTSSKGKPGGTGVTVTPPCTDCDTAGKILSDPPKPPVVTWASDPPTCDGLDAFFQRNIKYPQAAKDDNIQGTVWLEFIVDSKGRVSEIKIAKGVHPLLDKEVLRVAQKMPAWKGGSNNGEPVDFVFRKPVRFELGK